MQTQKIPLSYEDYAAGIHALNSEQLLRLMELISANLRNMEPEGNIPGHGDHEEYMRLFWESFGSWEDDRTTEDIVKDIYGARSSVERRVDL